MFASFSVFAGENWFVVATSTLGKSTVIEVYGWDDNQTPCNSIASAMNMMIENDYNPISKSFSCVSKTAADKLDRNNPLSMRKVE